MTLMKRFTIRFEIRSKTMSLEKLTNLTGFLLCDSSRNIGDFGGDGRQFVTTIGIIEAETNEMDSEEDDLISVTKRLIDKLISIQFDKVACKLSDTLLVVNVGAFFDTADCTLEISPVHALFFGQRNIKTSISFYPS